MESNGVDWIRPWLEEDVRWVSMEALRGWNGKLIALAERDSRYSIDLKIGKIRKLRIERRERVSQRTVGGRRGIDH